MHKRLKRILFSICKMTAGITVCILSHYQNTSAKRPEDKWSGDCIEQYHSSLDKDTDGMDDQIDILTSALEYIQTCPEYASKYYDSGYPDDGHGVCTDVVAFALKNSGYDLQELVAEDVLKHSEKYSIDTRDKNIDFRRVKNLHVYFENHACSLTTDVTDITSWQGGDIVIFKNHISIVSDRRNIHDVPYVIHHNSPWQKAYEQDILDEVKVCPESYK